MEHAQKLDTGSKGKEKAILDIGAEKVVTRGLADLPKAVAEATGGQDHEEARAQEGGSRVPWSGRERGRPGSGSVAGQPVRRGYARGRTLPILHRSLLWPASRQ